jgi:Outer membrane protein beta-barrel domain
MKISDTKGFFNLCSLFFLIACLSNTTTSGQILVGPVIGGQVNWMRFDEKEHRDIYNLKPIYNFHAGASISFRAQKRFFLQTSFLYTQKGKVLEADDGSNTSNNVRYKYIDVPILYTAEFKSMSGRDKVFKWYLGVGPTISYWLGGKGVLISDDLNENGINPPNYDLPYKIVFNKDPLAVASNEMNIREPNRIQLGLNISAGLVFEPIRMQRFMINARYSFGQSYFSKSGETKGEFGLPGIVYYEDELKIRSRELVLSLHYFIDLKNADRKKGKSTIQIK